MRAKLSLLFAICFISVSVFAQTGNETIQHSIEAGQTLYFISKKYDLSIAELRKYNPAILDDLIIKPEQVLVIPIKNKPVKMDDGQYKVHLVKTKETLFSISKMYGVKVDDLITLNNLETPNIDIGQKLKVEKLNVNNEAIFVKPNEVKEPTVEIVKPVEVAPDTKPVEKIPNPVVQEEILGNDDVSLYKQLFESYNKSGNILKKEKGIGNYLDGTNNGTYLAMVDGVPSGQIVKVRNLMNNKVIYLKVVGPIAAKDAGNNISIKISKAAASDLNIIEDRFLAEWTWYVLGTKKTTVTEETIVPFDDF